MHHPAGLRIGEESTNSVGVDGRPVRLRTFVQLALRLSDKYFSRLPLTCSCFTSLTVPRCARMSFLVLVLTGNLCAQPLHFKVSHAPKQPRSDEPVKITAAPEGKAPDHLWLELQVVEPGAYIRRTDPALTKDWREFPMEETNGTFTVSIPADLQKHRRLIRYRFKTISKTQTNYFPAITNTVSNFAWFVYDGAPAWSGAS